ncbi:MAG: SurA N-terminal domain-containing protein [Flavobacteriales bacterium]|nr:SurA N-terminal domain-containing protein [Flavobacteriales bacterium]MCX7768782.1 SurA N-terminal domain-containing protein [Flavobacteriales bacterium]MDW8409424.1 SurA N-terminal domain-containing protein [Flavobacteriales bacterium]
MAIIGKIRNRMGMLLVVLVGVAMLSFILGDFLSSAGFFFSGERSLVAVINGERIRIDHFDKLVKEKENYYMVINNKESLDNAMRDQVVDDVFNDLIFQLITQKQYDRLGLRVGSAEFNDMLTGEFIHPIARRYFTNPQTGQFDKNFVQNYVNNYLLDEANISEDQLPAWRNERLKWSQLEEYIIRDRLNNKYNNLIAKAMYVTSKEVVSQNLETSMSADVRFIAKNYSSLPDSAIQIEKKDLQAAYEKHKMRYRTDFASRSLKYAVFEVIPTPEDRLNIYNEIFALRKEFEATREDSLFVLQNSDSRREPVFLHKEKLTAILDSALWDAPDGKVVGPYADGDTFKLAKRILEKTSPDSVKLRAILIATKLQDGKERPGGKELADSLYGVIMSGAATLEEMALKYSDDQTTKNDSGDVGWVKQSAPGQNLLIDSAFAAQIGKIYKLELPIVTAIFRVEAKSPPTRKILVAFVNREVVPSKATENRVFNQAGEFVAKHKTREDFERAQKEGTVLIRDEYYLRDNARQVGGLEDSRRLVRWAFESEVGEVSAIEKFGNKYVVAIVTRKRSAGVPPLEEIEEELKPFALREKKARKFKEEIRTAMEGSKSLDDIAPRLQTNVQTATGLNFNSYFVPGVGYEPAFVGAACGAQKDNIYGPFQGNNGVYVLQVTQVTPGKAPEQSELRTKVREMSTMAGYRSGEAQEALKSYAGVRDYRYRFY